MIHNSFFSRVTKRLCWYWRSYILFFFSLLNVVSYAQTVNESQQLIITVAAGIDNDKIDRVFNEPFMLEQLTFCSDVFLEKDEFFYLVDLREGMLVHAAAIKKALSYLIKKNIFREIGLSINQGVNGKWLHFELKGAWIFWQVKLSGVLWGKDSYRNYYLMDPGDLFDEDKHNHAVKKIKEVLRNEGYFNNTVTSSFTYDHDRKAITVNLTIKKGNRFRIEIVDLAVQTEDDTIDDYSFLKDRLYKKFLRRLTHHHYEKEMLNQQAQVITDYLTRKGFLSTIISLKEQVDTSKQRVHINWTISIQHKRRFIFFGNYFFSQRQLLHTILQFGRSVGLLPAAILSEEIVRLYHEKGFWDVVIELQEEEDRCFFLIKEGKRGTLTTVEIHGAHHVAPAYLIKHCFRRLVKNKYIDTEITKQCLDNLIALYNKQGFLSSAVIDHDFVATETPGTYQLVVTIDEGLKCYITDIQIDSFPELLDRGPFRAWHKHKKLLLFDTARIQEQQQWLLQHFRQLGFVYVTVTPDIKTDEQNNVSVIWHIDHVTDKVCFGKTIVLGTNTLPFAYIMRELAYQQGQVWNQEKLKQSFLRLKGLDIFESIQLYPSRTQKLEKEKPLVLKLHNDDRFEIKTRAGLALQNIQNYQTFGGVTYKVGGSFLVKNPSNVGDQLRLDLDFAASHREIDGSYRRPWLWNIPLRTMVKGYSIKYDYPIGSDPNIYTAIQNGFLVNLERRSLHADSSINIGIEWMETAIRDTARADCLARAINFEPQLLNKMIPFFFCEPAIVLDYLDHNLNPTSGMFLVFSLKGMLPLQPKHFDSYFVKLLFEQSFFVPLRSLVLAFRFRFGHIFHQRFCAIMPIERFYLGGSHSLRGYEADMAPPLGLCIDDNGKKEFVPRGGKTMVNANCEIRFPLIKRLGGVIFQDIGLLSSDNFADFNPENVLAATGFGFRLHTPLGPLRFDIGWKWRRKKPVERAAAWFLTFGQSF